MEVQYNAVDLTEDEDSRETIVDISSPSNQILPVIHTVNASNPPPLTPIRQFTSFQNRNLTNQPSKPVPKLKKIRSSNATQQSMKSPQACNSNIETVCLDSDDEGIKQISPADTCATGSSSKITGKLVIIKKDDKFYRIIIPHNVVPTFNHNECPVLINIPGVGPLVIKLDPNARERTSSKGEEPPPLSLNFDDRMDTVASQSNVPKMNLTLQQARGNIQLNKPQEKRYKTDMEKIGDLLADTKFCWSLNKRRANGSHSTISYRECIGFSRAELVKAKKCWNTLEKFVLKKRTVLTKTIKIHNYLKQKAPKRNNVMPVKISEIIGKSGHNQVFVQKLNTDMSASDSQKAYIPEPFKCYEFQNVQGPPNTVITDYNDLYLTKKVVILKGDKEEEVGKVTKTLKMEKKRRKRRQKLSKHNTNNTRVTFHPKPCYVEIIRDEYIEQMHKNMVNKLSVHSLQHKFQQENEKYLPTIKTVWSIFQKCIIKNEEDFITKIPYIKPLLLLNEYNFYLVHYSSEFRRKNVIYSVNKQHSFPKSVLTNRHFLSAVELGYVKLVAEDILCSFLKGEFGSPSDDKITFIKETW